jgi:hypothetical protein
MLNNVIKIHHDEMDHCGVEKTFQDMYASYWFPSLRKKICDYIENCIVCLTSNAASNAKEGEMHLYNYRSDLTKQIIIYRSFRSAPENDRQI